MIKGQNEEETLYSSLKKEEAETKRERENKKKETLKTQREEHGMEKN